MRYKHALFQHSPPFQTAYSFLPPQITFSSHHS